MLAFLAVTILGVASALDQSETGNNQPMSEPEVVVQLKYDGGELNRIYLTQFRKDQRLASVPARPTVCADLCHSAQAMAKNKRFSFIIDNDCKETTLDVSYVITDKRLGGAACGSTCSALIPVGLKTALKINNASSEQFGQPRVAVCPALCQNQLGEPLCACGDGGTQRTNWSEICDAFCTTDGYTLNGCPSCESSHTTSLPTLAAINMRLDTSEGWQAWCNVQCRQGQGGAACNCDRTPF